MSQYGIPYMGSRSLLRADKTVGNKIEKVFVNAAGYNRLMEVKSGSTS